MNSPIPPELSNVMQDLFAQNRELESQNAELREALQACDNAGLFDAKTSRQSGIPDSARLLARAALARATGKDAQ